MRKVVLIFIAIFFLGYSNVKATSLCDYKEQTELSGKASNIKASYEIKEEEVIFDELIAYETWFDISILNITEEFYAIITNDLNDEAKEIYYKNTDEGVFAFEWREFQQITNLTIKIYSSDETNCPDEKIKTIYLTLPRYNEYSRRAVCDSYPEFYLCEKFVTFSDVKEESFLSQLNTYIEKNTEKIKDADEDDKNIDKNLLYYINEYKYIIAGTLAFIIILPVVIIIIKKKKQREFKI